jgi:tRNA pseudouridine55 synthase
MRDVQRALGASKSGHAGTLDPLASGLLVVLLGEVTKLSRWVMGCDKAYVATVALGQETDTLDAAGEVISQHPVASECLSPARVEAALGDFVGAYDQLPPVYSAIKRDGRTLMSRARAGETPEVAPRAVRCDALKLMDIRDGELILRVECGSGFYVRSLARDLAQALGTVGHLAGLVREAVGPWSLADALPPGEISAEDLVPLVDALPDLPKVVLTEEEAEHARHGRAFALAHEGPEVMAIAPDGTPLAMMGIEAEGEWRITRGFRLL